MILASEIRDWARENDVPVGTRGRLGPEVKTAYFRANPSAARAVLTEAEIEVPSKGRLSDSYVEQASSVLP